MLSNTVGRAAAQNLSLSLAPFVALLGVVDAGQGLAAQPCTTPEPKAWGRPNRPLGELKAPSASPHPSVGSSF